MPTCVALTDVVPITAQALGPAWQGGEYGEVLPYSMLFNIVF